MTLNSIQALARKHLSPSANTSDRFCLEQSIIALDELKDEVAAKRWALESLAHSVGVFHADYQKASR